LYIFVDCQSVTVHSDNKQSEVVLKSSYVTVGTVNSKCGNNHFKDRN